MLDTFKNLRVGYTSGDAFDYLSAAYTGYYTILSGDAFKGKLMFDEVLDNQNNFTNNVLTSPYLFDRTLEETTALIYNEQDFIVPTGEFITADNLNKYFGKFYENTNYLYSRFFIYDSNLPKGLSHFIGVTSATTPLTVVPGNDSFNPSNFTTNTIISGYDLNSTNSIAYKENELNNNYVIFTATSSLLVAVTGNTTTSTCGVSLCTSCISDVSGDYLYKDIVGMEILGDFLFVLDKGNNSIAKYNIVNFYSGDQSAPKQRLTIEIKGGGGKNLPSTFNLPNLITSSPTNIITYQQTDRFFKSYDVNLNLVDYRKVFRRVNEEVVGIGYNRFYSMLACIVKVNDIYTFYYLSDDFNVIESYPLKVRFTSDEKIKKIIFSENDSNVYYIVTTNYVYKMFVNKPGDLIGVFSDSNLNIAGESGNYLGATLVGSNSNYDFMILLKNNRFIFLNEPNTFVDILRTKNFSNYEIGDINLTKDEYFQANYINKELYKIFENITRLKNQLVGSFYAKYEITNNQLTYEDSLFTPSLTLRGINYFLNYDFLNITNEADYFIHENEPLNNSVINRCFYNLYNLQRSLLQSSYVANTSIVPLLTADNVLYLN